jgi:hypothetical protein
MFSLLLNSYVSKYILVFLTHFSLYLVHVKIFKKIGVSIWETHLTCFLQGRKFSCMHVNRNAHFFMVKYYFVVFIFIFFVPLLLFICTDARLFQPRMLAYRLYGEIKITHVNCQKKKIARVMHRLFLFVERVQEPHTWACTMCFFYRTQNYSYLFSRFRE